MGESVAADRPSRDGNYDVGPLTAVVNDISANGSSDSTRGYTTGASNRGMVTYALVCKHRSVRRDRAGRGNTAGRVSIAAAVRDAHSTAQPWVDPM